MALEFRRACENLAKQPAIPPPSHLLPEHLATAPWRTAAPSTPPRQLAPARQPAVAPAPPPPPPPAPAVAPLRLPNLQGSEPQPSGPWNDWDYPNQHWDHTSSTSWWGGASSTLNDVPADTEAGRVLTLWCEDGTPVQGEILRNILGRVTERGQVVNYFVTSAGWLWCNMATASQCVRIAKRLSGQVIKSSLFHWGVV